MNTARRFAPLKRGLHTSVRLMRGQDVPSMNRGLEGLRSERDRLPQREL